MTKSLIFFTAGAVPTTDEATAIAKLNLQASKALDVKVKRGDVPANQLYGYGKDAADYVSFVSPMTKPTAYDAVTTYDPDTPPALADNRPTTQAVWSSGKKYAGCTVTGSGTFATPKIVNGVVTGIVLSAS
jgi:hypothetical protein